MNTTSATTIDLPSLAHLDAWDTPILLNDCDTPDIPARLLPSTFGQFATELAQATETPEALSVMTILSVISTAIAKRFVVSPKEGWFEPVNIYTLIALPPANHKSLVLQRCTKPLVEWEKEQSLKLDAILKRRRSERKTQEKIIEGLRVKAAKANDPLEQEQLMHEISVKEANLLDVPASPLLFINDATPESLTTLVHEQKGRLGIFSDEGGILETLAGLYSNGVANVDILLKGIDGGEVRVRRKDRSLMLNPYLTIVLTIQPSVIQNMGGKHAYRGNGTLERFLYVLPKSKLGYRTHATPPLSAAIESTYQLKVRELLDQFAFMAEEKEQSPLVLKLDSLALHQWRDFQAMIEEQLRPNGKFASCQGWAGKISGFALRLAGLLHIAEEESRSLTITETTMTHALHIATLLAEHATVAFNLMGVDQVTEDAKAICQWLIARNEPSFTQSDIVLAMRNKKLGKSERLLKAMQLLHERNIISLPIRLATT
jgi:putative DNA primase/helicase